MCTYLVIWKQGKQQDEMLALLKMLGKSLSSVMYTLFPHCNTLQHTATHCNTLQHTAQQESEQCYVYTISNVICFVYRGKQRQKQRDEMLAVLKMLGKSMSKVKHVTFEIVLKMLPSISNTASVSSRFFCLCFPLWVWAKLNMSLLKSNMSLLKSCV